MVDEGNEDYLYYGTPIEREEEMSAGYKRKMALDAGQMRRLPPWKQEVTDEEGRRRFHGAFTGGFSAGFYNTVGSKEGWAPQTFTSSRKKRAEVKGQTVYNFLDDDEKTEFEARDLSASSKFDTFGFTVAEVARKQAEKELQTRPSAIPGPIPDEIIVPVAESIGMKLLVKMGWRHGRSIGASDIASISESRREARKAFLALAQNNESSLSPKTVYGVERQPLMQSEVIGDEKTNELDEDVDAVVQAHRSTPVFVIHPKNDLYGLGYDPFKNAPEFRERKYMHMSKDKERGLKKTGQLHENLFRPNAGKTATGFGIGALEDIEEEDEDIYSSGRSFFVEAEEGDEKPSDRLDPRKERTVQSHNGGLTAFKLASVSTCRKEWFIPPAIPPGFVTRHKFSVPLEVERNFFQLPPPEASPPHDSELCMMIEGLATFVARSGKIFEDLSREKNANNPLFCFLFGGPGHDYYRRKLWEEQKRLAEQGKVPIKESSESMGKKLNSEDRGRVLGETPLEKSSGSARKFVPSEDADRLQSILSDNFTKPASLLEGAAAVQPFQSDPDKQARFEQFLKDRYQGGLCSSYVAVGDNSMTEIERAQERLDFESAVEMTEKRSLSQKNCAPVNENLDLVSAVGTRFTSGGVETMDSMICHGSQGKTETKQFPQREEHQWRPSLLLCKRFNLLDPYAGKPPPLPKARSKMESLILISNPVRDIPETSSIIEGRSILTEKSVSQSSIEAFNPDEPGEDKKEIVEAKDTVIKKPVDLYKAIFSDESDNEEEGNTEKQLDSHEKSAQGANATLNRLIAGDFLESLGKELGLKVPRDLDRTQKGKDIPLVSKESKNMGEGETAAGNDISMPAKSSSQKISKLDPNPKSRIHDSVLSSMKSQEKEADAYGIGETGGSKNSGFKEENKIWHESGKSDYLGKSSTYDSLNNSFSDYDRGKDNVVEAKRKREPTPERRKSHSKRHHKRDHRSYDDNRRKKRDKYKESHDHKKRKSRKHRRRDSSLSSSSSESSHDS